MRILVNWTPLSCPWLNMTVLGGSNFGLNTSTAALRNSSCTSIPIPEDKSNYWFPVRFTPSCFFNIPKDRYMYSKCIFSVLCSKMCSRVLSILTDGKTAHSRGETLVASIVPFFWAKANTASVAMLSCRWPYPIGFKSLTHNRTRCKGASFVAPNWIWYCLRTDYLFNDTPGYTTEFPEDVSANTICHVVEHWPLLML
jgi:hypothetical protein